MFDPKKYGPDLEKLINAAEVPPLGPGTPNEGVRDELTGVTPNDLFGAQAVRSESMARACHSGVLLLHNFLEESHEISQSVDNPSGSFWHGIMHRREPDYGNAGYWFRKVSEHPVFPAIAERARELAKASLAGQEADFLRENGDWDPQAFIDFVSSVAQRDTNDPGRKLARDVQMAEWQVLFDYCYGAAVGE